MTPVQGRNLFIVNDFPPITGGQAAYLYQVCRCFSDNLVVLAPCVKDADLFDRAQSFAVIRRPYLFAIPLVEKVLKIVLPLFWARAFLGKQKVRLIHCAHVLSTGFIGLILQRLKRVDFVVYTHAADVLEYRSHVFWGFWLRRILRNARYVVTVSRFMREELQALGVLPERIVVASPRIDPAAAVPTEPVATVLQRHGLEGRRFILSIGRLVDRKGSDVVIRAMPALRQRFPGLTYVVFGTGPDAARLRALVRELRLQEAVIFIEGPAEDRKALLAGCDVFVMPSREGQKPGDLEGFGIVYLEAGACGKPVVAGNTGGVGDAVVDGETGLCVNPTDQLAVGEAIARLLANPGLASTLGSAGCKRVLAQFDANKGMPELERVFKD